MDVKDYSQYNLTIRLGSLLALPSKFLNRLRRIDDLLNHDLDVQSAALSNQQMPMTSTALNGVSDVARPPPSRHSITYEFVTMPGPFAFMTSGYALGLLALALLLNRIQHVVVPPRRSLAYRIIRSRRSVFHALFYSFFPIDLSSTAYRFTLRIPSLYLLYKNLAVLFVIILQATNFFPSTNVEWLRTLGQWASQKDMEDVCWSIFGTVCTTLVVGALTRGLEGFHSSNTQPFNIFGYAMLLHIYSMPVTHTDRGAPSRPDVNVLLTLFFPLLQLAFVHSLGVKKSWARHRLVPTSICSIATIIHFNAVLLIKPASYPMLNYLPCLLETMLFLVTILTIVLNALTQLLLEGEITRPLFGHAQTLAPKWDEDFAIVLLRLGTASLEATNVVGLGNEVGAVAIRDVQREGMLAKREAAVELNSSGVISMSYPVMTEGSSRPKRGFSNEIKNVKVKNAEDDWLIDHVWLRELTRYGLTLWAVIRGFFRVFLWLIWYKWKGVALRARPTEEQLSNGAPTNPVAHSEFRGGDTYDVLYGRFLRGEDVSDDEDEYVPSHERSVRHSRKGLVQDSEDEGEEEASDTEDDDSDGGNGMETAGLYSDLLLNSASSSSVAPGPVFIAHMTTNNASPLTRRRYNELVAHPQKLLTSGLGEQDKDELADFIRDRRVRASASRSESTEDLSLDGRMNCVICTSEPREIICWPCRCLALCNDCRENLASRASASKHNCPCCRRSVEGYSRIFIP